MELSDGKYKAFLNKKLESARLSGNRDLIIEALQSIVWLDEYLDNQN